MGGDRLARPGWVAFWGAVLALLGLLDLHRDRKRDGSTLSEATRFVVDRVPGPEPVRRAAFAFAWGRFAWWYWRHIDRH